MNQISKIITDNYFKPSNIIKINKGQENQSWKIIANGSLFVLRQYNKKRTNNQINQELSFMQFLDLHKLKVPQIIKNQQKHLVTMTKQGYYVLFEFVEGRSRKLFDKNLLIEIGKTLAEMHNTSELYPVKNKRPFDPARYFKKVEKSLPNKILGGKTICKCHSFFMKKIKPFNLNKLPIGLVHNDFSPENIKIKNNQISGIFDFDDLRFNPFISDLGIALFSFCFDYEPKKMAKKISFFLEGYRKKRTFVGNEKKLIIHFLLRRAIGLVDYYLIKNKRTQFNEAKKRVFLIMDNFDFLINSTKTILLFHWSFSPMVGGVVSYLEYLQKALASKGYSVLILTSKKPKLKKIDCNIFRENIIDPTKKVSVKKLNTFFTNFFNAHSIDLIHTQNLQYPFAQNQTNTLLQVAKNKKIIVINTVHDVKDDDQFLENLFNPLFSQQILVSKFLDEKIRKITGKKLINAVIIENGIDHEKFKPKQKKMNKKIVGVVLDRITPRKDITPILKSLIFVKTKNFVLLFSKLPKETQFNTYSEEYKKIESLMKNKDIKSKVKTHYWEFNEINKAYEEIDIVINNSKEEGFGYIFLEAMASGKPVIARQNNGFPSTYLRDKKNCLLTNGTAKEIATAIDLLSQNTLLYDRLKKNGFATANKFDIKINEKKVTKLYKKLLN